MKIKNMSELLATSVESFISFDSSSRLTPKYLSNWFIHTWAGLVGYTTVLFFVCSMIYYCVVLVPSFLAFLTPHFLRF